ncbi:hypothetical protein N7488_010508 [Penicillium malachiteum]|nr:hypothetical protein N7488_010508 [Penicillium malachiteum]
MSPQAFVLDSLWIALCPSFKQLALSQPRQRISKQCSLPTTGTAPTLHRRCYSSYLKRVIKAHNPKPREQEHERADTKNQHDETTTVDHTSEPESTSSPDHVQSRNEAEESYIFNGSRRRRHGIRKYRTVPESYAKKSDAMLESMLRNVTAKEPNIRSATQVLRSLIWDRKTPPHTRHYQALLLTNCDPWMGSPNIVRNLLQEMEDHNITADSGTLHAALKALAVHPDYTIRQDVLHKLRDRWLTLSPPGWHFMVAGLLREHQFELALDQMSMMERKGTPIENWLHSMAVYMLCDFLELDEVYCLMQARVEQGHDMTPELWGHVLMKASEHQHYNLTSYVWRRRVDLGYLDPSSEITSRVLTIASGAHDIQLAQAVFRFRDSKKYTLGVKEYQDVLKIHLETGDLPAAFSLLSTMHEERITIDKTTTHMVVDCMVKKNLGVMEAWEILKNLKEGKRAIPLECVQLILEVCERVVSTDSEVAQHALEFYKEMYTLCPEGATVEIYNTLLQICREADYRPESLFVVKEMASMNIQPDSNTFEALILLCLDARNYRSAYMYWLDYLRRNNGVVSLSDKTRRAILDLCAKSVNEFAIRFQNHSSLVEIQDQHVKKRNAEQQAARIFLHKKLRFRERHGRPWYRPAVYRKMLPDAERIAWNKLRRQNKRRYAAIARKRAGLNTGSDGSVSTA